MMHTTRFQLYTVQLYKFTRVCAAHVYIDPPGAGCHVVMPDVYKVEHVSSVQLYMWLPLLLSEDPPALTWPPKRTIQLCLPPFLGPFLAFF